ncbi:MAG: hypothetical protein QME41_02220 [Actinomycetota bacterium]|nr:hypothetical protein [Actinomycetota bacterium]
MNPTIDNVSVEEIESLICQIEEIKAARIVVGPGRGIEEIHILASSAKGPKQISRDIESMLMAQFGLPVNHRKISIAQLGSAHARVPRARPKLDSVRHEVDDRRARVAVTLRHGDTDYEGLVEGVASRAGRLRLVASATIAAVEQIILGDQAFALEDITAMTLGRDTVVVASVALLDSSGDETYVGCAIVKDDEREAIVRAVLDAVNRRLEFLITP